MDASLEETEKAMRERQARALERGAWACPRCEFGFEVYMINNDMHVCAVCHYKGGPIDQTRNR